MNREQRKAFQNHLLEGALCVIALTIFILFHFAPSAAFAEEEFTPLGKSEERITPAEPETPPPSAGAISKDGLPVELTTARGQARPFYKNGENIKFVIRLNRSAFIYLFELDPKGNAILLYPVGDNGHPWPAADNAEPCRSPVFPSSCLKTGVPTTWW